MSTQEQETDDSTDDGETDSEPMVGEFEGTITADALSVAFDALTAAANEAVAEFSGDGLVIHTVDPGDVLMVRVTLPAEAWEHYDAGDLRVGMKLERLSDMATTGDLAHLEWDTDQWTFGVESGPVTATLSVVGPDTVRTREPSQEVWDGTEMEWSMPQPTLREALSVSTTIGGKVAELITRDDWFGITKPGDNDHVEYEFTRDDAVDVHEREADMRVLMSEDYLSEVRKATPKEATLSCATKSKWPLILEFEHEGVQVEFVQAPRLPSN